MALDQSALLDLLGELKLTDVTDRIRVATETLYQELIDAEATAFIGAGTFFPALLERRRRVDQALFAVVMEAYVHGVSTRKVDDLVKALGADTGISKSEVSRICAGLDAEVAEFRDRTLAAQDFPYVFLDATYCKARVGGDKAGTQTMRMINASIKNRDIELRTATVQPDDDALVTDVLQKMIKQRRESVEMYTKGDRAELAAIETAEIAVIERFLPQQMSEDEAKAAIGAVIAETGAASMKDMGRVMALVKERHATSIEPARASALVKGALG